MRVEEESKHAEHVKMLEALASNLKSEVARGLRLLDTCVTNIAQAKWILTNVDDSLSGFAKGCPVCGTLPERDKPIFKAAGKDMKSKSTESSSNKVTTEIDRVNVMNKTTVVKSSTSSHQAVRKSSPSPPRAKAPVPAPQIYRVGPKSKTRPVETTPTSAVGSLPEIPAKAKAKANDTTPGPISMASKLPKICTIVVAQTAVQIKLTDVKPYLRGRSTKVDLNNLYGFVSPTKTIPSDLKFKPQSIKVNVPTVKKAAPGPASRKFFESLKVKAGPKSKTVTSTLLESNSSDEGEDKSVKAKVPAVPKVSAPAAGPPKRNDSDSGSDYDYNFAKAAPSNTTSTNQKQKSRIGSLVTANKRPRPLSTDSDEDYQYKKKKSSIFKKKVESTNSDSDDSDSDRYERKKKKKVKRKDSTDKEKEKPQTSKQASTGSKSSSVISSRMTITLPSGSKGINSTKSKCDSERRNSGSTIGSLVKSDTSKDVPLKSDSSKQVASTAKAQVPELNSKPAAAATVSAPAKTGYRPGPASRKLKLAQAVATSDATKSVEPSSAKQKGTDQINGNDGSAMNEKAKETEVTANTTNAVIQIQPASAAKADPFTLLKQQIKATQDSPVSGSGKEKPVSAPATCSSGISNLVSSLNPEAKAKLLAKLTLISSQKNKVSGLTSKPATPGLSPVQASLKALSALVKSPKPSSVESTPPVPLIVEIEEEKEIELGDDIIGKCIGDIGSDAGAEAPVVSVVCDPPSEPPVSITFQDCLSPVQDDCAEASPEPDSSSMSTVEKIQKLLLKLSTEAFEDAALLHSQDKINELFGAGLHSNSAEFETYRGDLQEGHWYLAKGKILGKSVCSDTISVFAWEQTPEEELNRILKELEDYTSACLR